ncbi:MAG TPA: alcohol dehydrogenase family protein [Chitinophagaceae bacterium]|nr:alcohol dehydrogenase family protein [Chitinophagaceae bacterium]
MHALTFGGKEIIEYSTVKDPVLLHPTDVIVKITIAGICGSDLHVYHGRETGLDHGTVMGHEFTGIVEETGSDVRQFKKGAKVLSPFTTSCGDCFYCRIGLTCRCEKGNLFGWVQKGHGLHGAQAGYIRVPMADSTLLPLSNDLNEKKGLLLGDVFSTGYFCADNAGINPKNVYAVIGCGPVGLMAIIAAKHLGAERLFAIDVVPERLAIAKKIGATPLNASLINVKEEILNNTNGRGADAVMEVVGSSETLKLAIELIRPGGTISSVGVHTTPHFSFSPGEAYDKNITYKSGRCPARYYAEKLLNEEVPQRYAIEDIITHQFSLQEGAKAYDVFDKKLDNCIKAVLLTSE